MGFTVRERSFSEPEHKSESKVEHSVSLPSGVSHSLSADNLSKGSQDGSPYLGELVSFRNQEDSTADMEDDDDCDCLMCMNTLWLSPASGSPGRKKTSLLNGLACCKGCKQMFHSLCLRRWERSCETRKTNFGCPACRGSSGFEGYLPLRKPRRTGARARISRNTSRRTTRRARHIVWPHPVSLDEFEQAFHLLNSQISTYQELEHLY